MMLSCFYNIIALGNHDIWSKLQLLSALEGPELTYTAGDGVTAPTETRCGIDLGSSLGSSWTNIRNKNP